MMKKFDLLDNWKEPEGVVEWGNSHKPPISPAWEYYINCNIHPDDMSVLFRVIFPDFVEVDDCTLLNIKAEGFSEDMLFDFRRQLLKHKNANGDSSVFERNFNIFKVYDLFSHRDVEYDSAFEQAALLLKQSWELTLRQLFPNKTFEVILSNTDRDYGPTLTFYTKR